MLRETDRKLDLSGPQPGGPGLAQSAALPARSARRASPTVGKLDRKWIDSARPGPGILARDSVCTR